MARLPDTSARPKLPSGLPQFLVIGGLQTLGMEMVREFLNVLHLDPHVLHGLAEALDWFGHQAFRAGGF
jgi:hypothetical protein